MPGLENVQMAAGNGGVLIACLQIGHRLLPSQKSGAPTLYSAEKAASAGL